jgi:6-pyruvoyltetrahydropterin/6-carboxytetrahydropterin synthase
MILTYGQRLDFVSSHRSNSSSSPTGRNYRLWAGVTGPLRQSTGLIIPRTTLDRALAALARQFDRRDTTKLVRATGVSPVAVLAESIQRQLTLQIGAPRSCTVEIADETGHGSRRGPANQPREGIQPRIFTLAGTFSAAHRAHAPRLSDAENRALFGTSNNAAGHGHNYRVEIESPQPVSDQPAPWAALDHLNLSHDVPELQGRNAVTETVAELIARRSPPGSRVRVFESADLFAAFDSATGLFQLGRGYRFNAAHTLADTSLSPGANLRRYGRCALASPHGHAYRAYVVVEGRLDPMTDTVYNLGDLDTAAGALLRSFDFTNWRRSLPELRQGPPTPEAVALALWARLEALLGPSLIEFHLYETPHTRVLVKRGPDG